MAPSCLLRHHDVMALPVVSSVFSFSCVFYHKSTYININLHATKHLNLHGLWILSLKLVRIWLQKANKEHNKTVSTDKENKAKMLSGYLPMWTKKTTIINQYRTKWFHMTLIKQMQIMCRFPVTVRATIAMRVIQTTDKYANRCAVMSVMLIIFFGY